MITREEYKKILEVLKKLEVSQERYMRICSYIIIRFFYIIENHPDHLEELFREVIEHELEKVTHELTGRRLCVDGTLDVLYEKMDSVKTILHRAHLWNVDEEDYDAITD